MKNLREQKYIALMAIVVLFMAIIGLISTGQIDKYKGLVKVENISSTILNADINNVTSSNEVTSKGYDEIDYKIKYTLSSQENVNTRNVIITAKIDNTDRYSKFKEVKSSKIESTLSEDKKEIQIKIKNVIVGRENSAKVKVVIEGAPNGYTVTPKITIKEETGEEERINTNQIKVVTNSLQGKVLDENNAKVSNVELSLNKDGSEIKRTYTDEEGNYVFSDIENEDYVLDIEEENYEKSSQKETENGINLFVRKVEPYNLETHKYINKVKLVVNGKEQTYTYGDIEKAVQAVKNMKELSGEITYKIKIKNTGEKAGFISQIKDPIIEGLSFDENKNTGWEKEENVVYYRPLEGLELKSNEERIINLTLDIQNTKEARIYINKLTTNAEKYERVVFIINNETYKEEDVLYNEKLTKPKVTIENFEDWYTDKNYTNKYNFNNPVTKDLVLYGKVDKNVTYSVIFNDKNPETGEVTKWDEQEITEGETVEEPEEPEHTGYIFKCWEDENHNQWDFNTPITEDLELISCYDKEEYNVNFYDYNNDINKTIKVKYKETIDTNEVPVLPEEGYTFKGWYELTKVVSFDFTTEITRNIDLYPKHEINKNDVTFNDEDRITTQKVDYGSTAEEIAALGKEGYTFKHWSLEREGTSFDFTTPIKAATTLYAVYEINKYNVTFIDKNPETNAEIQYGGTQIINHGSKVTKPEDPSKTGYTFKSWKDETGTAWDFENDIVTSDITLISYYEINNYSVLFMDQENQFARQTVQYKAKATRPETNPTKAHNIFTDWKEEDIEEAFDFENTPIVKNTNLFSNYEEVDMPTITHTPTQWTKNSVTVTITSDHEDYTYKYATEDGVYKDYTGPFTIDENTTIYAISIKDNVPSLEATHVIDNIDKISPTITSITTDEITPSSFKVNIKSKDNESGLSKQKIYVNEEEVYSSNEYTTSLNEEKTENYTVSNLQEQTIYRVKIVSIDKVGNETEEEKEVTTTQRIFVAQIIGRNNSNLEEENYEKFETLKSAIDACPTGQCTIQMLLPVTESNTINENQDITLDLNGKVITGTRNYTFENDGKFNVVDRNEEISGSIINNDDTAIINNNIFTLGENEEELVVSKEKPIIQGNENGIYNNNIFNFYDGKIIGTLAIKGEVTETPYSYNASVSDDSEIEKQVAILEIVADAEARIESVYYTKLQNAIDESKNGDYEEVDYTRSIISQLRSDDEYRFIYDTSTKHLVSNNPDKQNTTAHSYIKLDLTNYDEDQLLTVNATISSQSGYDIGYVTVTEDVNTPTYDQTEGRFIYMSGEKTHDYTKVLEKGKTYYLHIGYRKNENTNAGTDTFTINSINLGNYETSDLNDLSNAKILTDSTYYFEKQEDGSYASTNKAVSNSTANSYFVIDMTNIDEDKYILIDVSISSQSGYDIGYITVTDNASVPAYNNTSGRQVYISGVVGRTTYPIKLIPNQKNFIHFGYYKNGSNNSNEDIFKIYSIKTSENKLSNITDGQLVNNGDYYFEVQEDGSYINNNKEVHNTTAHSYMKFDLTDYIVDQNLIINAKISSQSGQDYGYITVTDTQDAPEYNNTSGRYVYISGENNSQDYIVKLTAGKENYVHFGYRKNANTNTGLDSFTINSIKYYSQSEGTLPTYILGDITKETTDTFTKPNLNEEVDKVQIIRNITMTKPVEIVDTRDVELDLNGYTLTTAADDYIINNKGSLTIIDTKEDKTGNITSTTSSVILNDYNSYLNIQDAIVNLNKSGSLDIITNRGSLTLGDNAKLNGLQANNRGINNTISGDILDGSGTISMTSSNNIGIINHSVNDDNIKGYSLINSSSNSYNIYNNGNNDLTLDEITSKGSGIDIYQNTDSNLTINNSNLESTSNESFYSNESSKESEIKFISSNIQNRIYNRKSSKRKIEIIDSDLSGTRENVYNYSGKIKISNSNLENSSWNVENYNELSITDSSLNANYVSINNGNTSIHTAITKITNTDIVSKGTQNETTIRNYGDMQIDGGSISNESANSTAIYNYANGILKVFGNFEINEKYTTGIYNVSELTLGNNEDVVSITHPLIQATSSAIYNSDSATYNYYDGKLIGKKEITLDGIVNEVPSNYDLNVTKEEEIETIILKSENEEDSEDDYVAQIGSTKYTTIQKAINAVTTTEETEIKLLKNIETVKNNIISAEQNIKINQQNYYIKSYNNETLFTNNGTLKFIDNEPEENNKVYKNFIVNNNNLSYDDIKTMALRSNDIITTSEDSETYISGGEIYSYQTRVINNAGELNITGGKIYASRTEWRYSGSYNLIENSDTGNIIINGGEISFIGSGNTIRNSGNVEVSNTTVNLYGYTIPGDSSSTRYEFTTFINNITNTSEATITGGTYGDVARVGLLIRNTGEATIENVTSNLMGSMQNSGTLTATNTKMENLGYYHYYVGSTTSNIGNTGTMTITGGSYKGGSLQGFINNASAKLTIDGTALEQNDCAWYSTNCVMIYLTGNSDVNIKNSTIKRTSNNNNIGAAVNTQNATKLTMENTSIANTYSLDAARGIVQEGTSEITMTNTDVTTKYADTIYKTGSGKLDITGGDIKNETGSYGLNNTGTGIININAKSLKSLTGSSGIYNTAATTITIGEQGGVPSKTEPDIEGKTYGLNNTNANAIINFYDGRISGETAIQGKINEVEEGYEIILETDEKEHKYLDKLPIVINRTKVSALENPTEEEIEEYKYYTIQEAIDAADNNDVIELLRELTTLPEYETITIPTEKKITFDLKGYKIYQNNTNFIKNNGELIIKTTETGGRIESNNESIFINNGVLKIQSGIYDTTTTNDIITTSEDSETYISGGEIYSYQTRVINNAGELNITGGKIYASRTEWSESGTYNLIETSGKLKITNGELDFIGRGSTIYNTGEVEVIDVTANSKGYYHYCAGCSTYSPTAFINNATSTSKATITGGTYGSASDTNFYNSSNSMGMLLRNTGEATIENVTSNFFGTINNSGTLTMKNITLKNIRAITSGSIENSGTMIIEGGEYLSLDTSLIYNSSSGNLEIKNTKLQTSTGNNNGSVTAIFRGNSEAKITNTEIKRTISSGSIYSAVSVEDSAKVEINNSEIQNTGTSCYYSTCPYGIKYVGGGKLTLNNTDINVKAVDGIYKTGSGELNITGGTITNELGSYGLNNTGSGIININSGNIISNKDSGIYISSGTINIGTKGGIPSITDPNITGKTYGLYVSNNNATINFYDGIIKGETGSIYGVITEVEPGYKEKRDNVTDEETQITTIESTLTIIGETERVAVVNNINFTNLQSAINYSANNNGLDVILYKDVTLENNLVSPNDTEVNVYLNNHTITQGDYTIASSIKLINSSAPSSLGAAINDILYDALQYTNNPINIIIYEMEDGSKLSSEETYKLYKDDKLLKMKKDEGVGNYTVGNAIDEMTTSKDRIYINNLTNGEYKLVSNTNKEISFTITDEGKILGNVKENNNLTKGIISEALAEYIVMIQTGINKPGLMILCTLVGIIVTLLFIIQNKKRFN